MLKNFSSTFWVFIISLISGLVAGTLAYLSFGSGLITIPYVSQWYLSRQYLGRELVITQPRKVVVEQDLQIAQVGEKAAVIIASLYSKNNSSGDFYLPTEKIGVAVVLTSDGWLVTRQPLPKDWQNLEVVTHDRQKLNIQQVVADKLLGVTFLKVEGKNLPTATLATADSLSNGQQVLVFSDLLQTINTSVLDGYWRPATEHGDLTEFTDRFSNTILLQDKISLPYALVFNYQSELVGFLLKNNEQQILPAWQLALILPSLLKQQVIIRPSLGIGYVDLADNLNLQISLEYGALVKSVVKGSSAEGSLQVGDIILAVNNQELSNQKLNSAIQQHQVGEAVDLKILRDNKERTISLKLSQLK